VGSGVVVKEEAWLSRARLKKSEEEKSDSISTADTILREQKEGESHTLDRIQVIKKGKDLKYSS